MAIKQINGKNAYVIEVPATTSKTSRGEGYGQFVTNLRWKMWEEAQKSVLLEMEFEKLGYQQQMKLYAQQAKDIQKEIDSKNKAINALNLKELARDQALENAVASAKNANARQSAGFRESRLRQQSSQEFMGQPGTAGYGRGGRRATKDDPTAGLSNDAIRAHQAAISASNIAANADPAALPEAKMEAMVAKVQEVGNINAQAAGRLQPGEIEQSKGALVADTLKNIRDAARVNGQDADAAETAALNIFGQDYKDAYRNTIYPPEDATGGSGGGGSLARTPAPITEKLSGAGVTRAKAVDYSPERERLQKELAELTAALQGMKAPTVPQFDLLERTREKFGTSYGEGGFGLAPRRDKVIPRFDEPAAVRAALDIAEIGAQQGIADYLKANPSIQADSLTPEQIASIRRQGVLGMLGKLGGRPVTAPEFLDKPVSYEAARLRLVEEARRSEAQEAARLRLVEEARAAEPAPAAPAAEPAPTAPPAAETPTAPPARRRLPADETLRAYPNDLGVYQETPERTIAQRQGDYKLARLAGAQKLAGQRERYENIARHDLAPAERKVRVAQWLPLVENLMAANKDKDDPVRETYAELNRAYKDDPETRAQATEYVLATSMLQSEAKNPVA